MAYKKCIFVQTMKTLILTTCFVERILLKKLPYWGKIRRENYSSGKIIRRGIFSTLFPDEFYQGKVLYHKISAAKIIAEKLMQIFVKIYFVAGKSTLIFYPVYFM